MKYKVIKEYCGDQSVIETYSDYNRALNKAIDVAKSNSSSEFHGEIQEALENRGYYMCGWSSTKVLLEEVD